MTVSDVSGFNTPERVSQPPETPLNISSAVPEREQIAESVIQPIATPPLLENKLQPAPDTTPSAVSASKVEPADSHNPLSAAEFEEIKQDSVQDTAAAPLQESSAFLHTENTENGTKMDIDMKEEVPAAEEAKVDEMVSQSHAQPNYTEEPITSNGEYPTQARTLADQQENGVVNDTEDAISPKEAVEEGAIQPVKDKTERNHVEVGGSSQTPVASLPGKVQQVEPEVKAAEMTAATDAPPTSSSVEEKEPNTSEQALLAKSTMPESNVFLANTSESTLPSAIDAAPTPHPNEKTSMSTPSQSSVPVTTSQPNNETNGSSSVQATIPAAESSSAAARRQSPPRVSVDGLEKARQEEVLRIQRENEDMRLMWLSLPANDHITYYSDTEEEGSGDTGEFNSTAPKGVYGGIPLLSRTKANYSNGKRKRQDWQEDERESSDSDDENVESQEKSEERRYRTGNRGNKLVKGARWNRRGKLGLWTEAKNEKDMHDRFMTRVKAIQRANIESLLYNAPGPKVIQEDGPLARDLLEGSDRMLFRDINSSSIVEENLQSTCLAPALLRPIMSARALLESHTLRHTFRNPHIGALSKTALDLRESEGHLSRALGRCFSGMERMSAYVIDSETGEVKVNGSQNTNHEIDPKAIGTEGTAGTADEVNPALLQLDNLFVTKKGLPIPVGNSDGEEQGQSAEMQAVLSTHQQRDVVRAALECLQDLGIDSLEYVERLDEVRGRLEAVKRRRIQVWEALRLWAIKKDGGDDEDGQGEVEEDNDINIRTIAKPPTTAVTSGNSASKRRR